MATDIDHCVFCGDNITEKRLNSSDDLLAISKIVQRYGDSTNYFCHYECFHQAIGIVSTLMIGRARG